MAAQTVAKLVGETTIRPRTGGDSITGSFTLAEGIDHVDPRQGAHSPRLRYWRKSPTCVRGCPRHCSRFSLAAQYELLFTGSRSSPIRLPLQIYAVEQSTACRRRRRHPLPGAPNNTYYDDFRGGLLQNF